MNAVGNFVPQDAHVLRSVDTQADALAVHAHDVNGDPQLRKNNSIVRTTTYDKHGRDLLCGNPAAARSPSAARMPPTSVIPFGAPASCQMQPPVFPGIHSPKCAYFSTRVCTRRVKLAQRQMASFQKFRSFFGSQAPTSHPVRPVR